MEFEVNKYYETMDEYNPHKSIPAGIWVKCVSIENGFFKIKLVNNLRKNIDGIYWLCGPAYPRYKILREVPLVEIRKEKLKIIK
jgi:hypothetical protein